jgi:hypothetical protein
MRTFLTLAALAATTAFAAPAAAQSTAPSAPSNSRAEVDSLAVIVQPATITGVAALDFGIVAAGITPGTVTVTPGANSVAVTQTGGSNPLGGARPGRFDGNGLPGQEVIVTVTGTPSMRHSNGVDTIGYVPNAYGAGTITIAADGLFRVLVGGTISMRANQAPGLYEGKVYVNADFQ